MLTAYPPPSAISGGICVLLGKAASLVFYAAAIPLTFVSPWLACALYVLVHVMWLIPDRRIERALAKSTPMGVGTLDSGMTVPETESASGSVP